MRTISFFNKIIFSVFAGIAVIGCSGSKQTESDSSLIWPTPPDEPRIKYVKTYHGESDFESKLGAITRTLAGSANTLNLRSPYDICTDGEGHLWVTDASVGAVVFDEVKQEVKMFAEESPIPLKTPRGIAYGNKKLFIGLADIGQVLVFSTEGKLLYTIGRRGQFPNPVDVGYDTVKHHVMVVDNRLNYVLVYSEKGDSLFAFGGHGSLNGYFNYPQSIATDSLGNVYVVDTFNFRIEIFDSTGKFLRKFGSQGDVYATFGRPKGIALDTYGNIYVLDAVHNNLQIFNNKAEFLMFLGKFSPTNEGFQDPVSICIDRKNAIYITDHLNSRVQVFQLLKGN